MMVVSGSVQINSFVYCINISEDARKMGYVANANYLMFFVR
jgi:hypothetical protein